ESPACDALADLRENYPVCDQVLEREEGSDRLTFRPPDRDGFSDLHPPLQRPPLLVGHLGESVTKPIVHVLPQPRYAEQHIRFDTLGKLFGERGETLRVGDARPDPEREIVSADSFRNVA